MPTQENKWEWIDLVSTLILAISTLAVAWCSYQGNLWNGIQLEKLAESTANDRMAIEIRQTVLQHQIMDEAGLIGLIRDVFEQRQSSVKRFLPRLRPELAAVVRSWISSDPVTNPKAAAHPLVMKEYKALWEKDLREARVFADKALRCSREAQQADKYSDKYEFLSVLFSAMMFLVAIAPKANRRKLTLILTVVAAFLCVTTLIMLFTNMPLAPE